MQKRLVLLKMDMEWCFVDKAMKSLGFLKEFSFMIFTCISSIEYALLLNGSRHVIQPQCGLKQGDPLFLSIYPKLDFLKNFE